MFVRVEVVEGFEVAADLGELGGKFGVGVARRAGISRGSIRPGSALGVSCQIFICLPFEGRGQSEFGEFSLAFE